MLLNMKAFFTRDHGVQTNQYEQKQIICTTHAA